MKRLFPLSLIVMVFMGCNDEISFDPQKTRDKAHLKDTLTNARIVIAENEITDFTSFTNQIASTFGEEYLMSISGNEFSFCQNIDYWNENFSDQKTRVETDAISFSYDDNTKISIKFDYRIVSVP